MLALHTPEEATASQVDFEMTKIVDHSGASWGHDYLLFEDGSFLLFNVGNADTDGRSSFSGTIIENNGSYCFATGSVADVTEDGDLSISGAIHVLNACGDTPVAGEVNLCDEFVSTPAICTGDSPETTEVWGTIDGQAIEGGIFSLGLGGGMLEIDLEDAEIFAFPAEVGGEGPIEGFFVMDASDSRDRAIYCFGEGSQYSTVYDSTTFEDLPIEMIQLRSFSKIDPCPADLSCDLVEGCLNY